MSWLYTIVFAGLMFSSQGDAVSKTGGGDQPGSAAAASLKGDETEKFEQSYPLNANGRVKVSNVNGSITVEAWDRNEVKLEYTKVADSKERLADVEVRIDSKPEYFSVETDYGDWKRDRGGWRSSGKLTVEFRLMVPRGAVLNEIETVNGSVAVSNFVNVTRVSAVNGSVKALNIRGTARLCTVNGEVTADFDRLETGSKISLETVNGRVNLVIPSDSNATVRADSVNGNITNDFNLPVRKGKYVGRDLYGRLGSGDVQIRLNSVNGGLAIGRKNDGKGLSPATNLLPQKEKDNEDWDGYDDGSMGRAAAKLDKDIAKAVKETTKARAAVDVHKKIPPEIAKVVAESITRTADAIQTTAEYIGSKEFEKEMQKVQASQEAAAARMGELTFFPSVPRVEKKSRSFPVKGVPKVTVDAKGCSVSVHGWDKSEVSYRVTQVSEARNRAEITVRDDGHTESSVNLRVNNPGGFFSERSVRIEIFVPRRSNLKITADGEIRLEGVSGDVQLAGGNESINVRDADGMLRVSNSDGRIRVIGFRGEVIAETSDGMINLEGDFRKLTARASEGSIILTLPENTSADLETNCSDLKGEGIGLTRVSKDTEEHGRYRLGKGGAPFKIETGGEMRVRGAGTLNESF